GAEGATSTAPMVPPKYLSVTGAQDCPALIDLKTPPPVVPIQNSFSRDGLPVTATERPPRKGPTSRQCRPAKTVESGRCCAQVGIATETEALNASASAERADERIT